MTKVPDLEAISCVRGRDLDQLRRSISEWGMRTLELDGSGVSRGSDLWTRASETLPIPESIAPHGWDAFKDAMFEAVTSLGSEAVALVWTHADDLVAGDLQDFLVAASILESLYVELVRGRGVRFHTFVSGDAPGYRPLEQIVP